MKSNGSARRERPTSVVILDPDDIADKISEGGKRPPWLKIVLSVLFVVSTALIIVSVALTVLRHPRQRRRNYHHGHGHSHNDEHYAVVVDAGSSGSRAYLYSWPAHSGRRHELLKIEPLTGGGGDGRPKYKKVKPGLSSLQDRPDEVLDYISPLLDFALEHIPASQVAETPLYILATAGMRLVGPAKRERIMARLRAGVNSKYGFLFPADNLEIISGKQEGVYQWLAINYVLGKFKYMHHRETEGDSGHHRHHDIVHRPRTVGAIDMGGASMQFAMEVTKDISENERLQVEEINLGCSDDDTEHTYKVFVKTFLGYGANEALARHRRDLLLSQIKSGVSNLTGISIKNPIQDPCLAKGFGDEIPSPISDPNSYDIEESYRVQLSDSQSLFVLGTGEWDKCYESLKEFTTNREKFSRCEAGTTTPCPDEGISVPAIEYGAAAAEFFAFSEFWYSMEDVLKMGGPYSPATLQKAARDFCLTPWPATMYRWKAGEYPNADQQRMETQCFKSAWFNVALHEGFGFPQDYTHLASAPETVNGKVVHWTIGALLYRTRFLPLRAINRKERGGSDGDEDEVCEGGETHRRHRTPLSPSAQQIYSNYVVFMGVLLIITAVLAYMQMFKRYTKRPNFFRRMSSAMPAIWEQVELKNTCWIRRDGAGAFQPASSVPNSPSMENKTLKRVSRMSSHRRSSSLPKNLHKLEWND